MTATIMGEVERIMISEDGSTRAVNDTARGSKKGPNSGRLHSVAKSCNDDTRLAAGRPATGTAHAARYNAKHGN